METGERANTVGKCEYSQMPIPSNNQQRYIIQGMISNEKEKRKGRMRREEGGGREGREGERERLIIM